MYPILKLIEVKLNLENFSTLSHSAERDNLPLPVPVLGHIGLKFSEGQHLTVTVNGI